LQVTTLFEMPKSIRSVGPGDEVFVAGAWLRVQAVACPKGKLGVYRVTFADGHETRYASGAFVLARGKAPVPNGSSSTAPAQSSTPAPAAPPRPAHAGRPGPRAVQPTAPEPGAALLVPLSSIARKASPPVQVQPPPERLKHPPASTLDYSGRILIAVMTQSLPSARAVFRAIGGHKPRVFETVKAMLEDGRLVTDTEGVYRAGRGSQGSGGRRPREE
jgi:hypothetical protein